MGYGELLVTSDTVGDLCPLQLGLQEAALGFLGEGWKVTAQSWTDTSVDEYTIDYKGLSNMTLVIEAQRRQYKEETVGKV